MPYKPYIPKSCRPQLIVPEVPRAVAPRCARGHLPQDAGVSPSRGGFWEGPGGFAAAGMEWTLIKLVLVWRFTRVFGVVISQYINHLPSYTYIDLYLISKFGGYTCMHTYLHACIHAYMHPCIHA